jgi:acyl transferase domain-containing protein
MKSASDGSLKQEPIAIIGLGTLAPKSRNVREFWDNVVSGRDCMDEVPPVLGRKEDYYDPSPTAPKEKLPSWRVGMLPEVDFDPLEFGIPPVALEAVSMAQLHGLRVAQEAMVDAGYWGAGSAAL